MYDDDDIDPYIRYARRRRGGCRCHSASEEPCSWCQTMDHDFGDEPDPNEERARLEVEQHARVCELLDAPVNETLYTDEDTMRAAIEAARAGEDE